MGSTAPQVGQTKKPLLESRCVCRLYGCAAAILLLTHTLSAQQSAERTLAAKESTSMLKVVDVIVTKDQGAQVKDLRPTDLTLEDNGKKHGIVFLQQFRGDPLPLRASVPREARSNRPDLGTLDGPLTVLLVDGLNTPSDHETARLELLRYAEQQGRLREVAAVYVLGRRLYKLKDISSDLSSGQDEIRTRSPADSAAPTSGRPRPPSGPIPHPSAFGGGVDPDFVTEREFLPADKRVQITLATMRNIARELYAYPGRKNLIWVTAGLPVTLDPQVNHLAQLRRRVDFPYGSEIWGPECLVGDVSANEIPRTAALVSDARLAIYGVDARGVVGSMSSQQDFGPNNFSDACLAAFSSNLREVAAQTGGRVLSNPEGVGRAVIETKTDSANSYAVGYYRDRDNLRISFRKLKLTSSRQDIKLHHRTGYFEAPRKMTPREQASEVAGGLYDGATQARMVLFEALLGPPRSAGTLLVPIQFRVSSDAFTAEEAEDGTHRLNLDFFVMAVTHDGNVAARAGKTVDAALSRTDYAQVEAQGLVLPLEISLSPGRYRIGLAVVDNRTGSIGSLNIPLELKAP